MIFWLRISLACCFMKLALGPSEVAKCSTWGVWHLWTQRIDENWLCLTIEPLGRKSFWPWTRNDCLSKLGLDKHLLKWSCSRSFKRLLYILRQSTEWWVNVPHISGTSFCHDQRLQTKTRIWEYHGNLMGISCRRLRFTIWPLRLFERTEPCHHAQRAKLEEAQLDCFARATVQGPQMATGQN